MRLKTFTIFAAMTSQLMVSACGVHKSKFDCDAASGMHCKSMGEINEILDKEDLKLSRSSSRAAEASAEEQNVDLGEFPTQVMDSSVEQDPTIHRVAEETLRVWVAPYKNDADEYVDAFHMHIVTKEGRWDRR